MSARVCYLRRTDRGDVLAGVRLVGAYTDDSWQAPDNAGGEFDPVEHVRLAAHAASEWIAHALHASKGSRSIDVVCLDGRGKVSLGGEDAAIEAGQRVLWPADVPHRLWTEDATMMTLMVEHPPAP